MKVLDADEGARRLGEVALVPHSSPIFKSGLVFFNTLFDENAACHIAIGQCYSECFVGGVEAYTRGDRGAGRQQEHDPYRLDDRLRTRSTSTASTRTATARRSSATANGLERWRKRTPFAVTGLYRLCSLVGQRPILPKGIAATL